MHRNSSSGFSLVELSIVLVILGLIIGGTLAGKNLIRAAELRSVVTRQQEIVAAVNNFKLKYNALPGDMKNATAYWGVQHATPATCATTASTTALTCDGDGNGKIDVSTGSQERHRFWQHLANAGMLEGQYNGVDTGGALPGVNVLAGKITGSWYYATWLGTVTADTYYYDGDLGNLIQLNGPISPYPIITPGEMMGIDQKFDDSKPGLGGIRALKPGYNPNCADSDVAATAIYMASVNDVTCRVVFLKQF